MAGSSRLGRAGHPARPRRSLRLGLSVIALGTLFLTACSPPDRRVLPDASGVQTTSVDCQNVRSSIPCAVTSVGGRSYRYSITRRPGAGRSARAVLVDLGGPGRALFSNTDLLDYAKTWPGNEMLVFLEEPWVTQPV